MERNISLDYFKIILSILVITMHTRINSTGLLGWTISECLARIAVPCFFIMNGFFADRILHDFKKLKKYLITLSIVYITWSFIYSPLYMTNTKEAILSILINGYSHLWYIVALMFSITILYLVRNTNTKITLIVAVLCFVLGYFYQRTYLLGINIELPKNIIFRTVSLGFPFMYIGYYLKNNAINISLKTSVIITVIVSLVFFGESLLAFNYLNSNNLRSNYEIYLSMIFVCPLIVHVISQIKIQSDNHSNSLSKIASGIYFMHLWVIIICLRIFDDYTEFRRLPIIIIFSLIFSAGIYVLNKRIKIFL